MSLKEFFKSKRGKRVLGTLMPISLILTSCGAQEQTGPQLPTSEELIELSDNVLTPLQASNRIKSALDRHNKGFNVYTSTRQNADIYYKNCFQMDYDKKQVPKVADDFYESTKKLREGNGIIATAIRQQANSADILFCFANDLPATTFARWNHDSPDGIVQFNRCTNYEYRKTNTVIHEVFHSIQGDLRLINRDKRFSIPDRQINLMSVEAAARVIPRLHELELYVNGQKSDFLKNDTEWVIDKAIWNSYKASAANKEPHLQAMETAGQKAWLKVFEMQWWLDGYNKNVITTYISNFQEDGLVKAAPHARFTLEKAQKSGWLDDNFNFTRGLTTIPDFQSRIGDNKNIRQIYELLEVKHKEKLLGKNHPTTKSAYVIAYQNGNPFLNVNLDDINLQSRTNVIDQIMDLSNGKPRAPDEPKQSKSQRLTSKCR